MEKIILYYNIHKYKYNINTYLPATHQIIYKKISKYIKLYTSSLS